MTVNLLLFYYFNHIWGVGGGGLDIDRGIYLKGESLFNLANTMVSVLNNKLEHKVENFKYKKL